jgi:hypothetical protein
MKTRVIQDDPDDEPPPALEIAQPDEPGPPLPPGDPATSEQPGQSEPSEPSEPSEQPAEADDPPPGATRPDHRHPQEKDS